VSGRRAPGSGSPGDAAAAGSSLGGPVPSAGFEDDPDTAVDEVRPRVRLRPRAPSSPEETRAAPEPAPEPPAVTSRAPVAAPLSRAPLGAVRVREAIVRRQANADRAPSPRAPPSPSLVTIDWVRSRDAAVKAARVERDTLELSLDDGARPVAPGPALTIAVEGESYSVQRAPGDDAAALAARVEARLARRFEVQVAVLDPRRARVRLVAPLPER
jgi:hypothetical protein